MLGLVSGIVGIGGGIYLIPIMFRIGSPKEAAATAAIFVWSVSFSGLVSCLQYNSIDLTQYMPLIAAVIIGGFLGSYIGSFRLSPKAMEKILGLIILVAIAFLFKKLLF
ncbi:TSUP family transporter [Isorropodon fossajaponicum symbiont]|uniref:TSUP family transporter n=1 Tax=Isorropodon fossajaponicum symbiont TaxID=883811 RepID=UPI001CECD888|nr:TSUP family transporter [Isorropodon fossajaponicum symbiont]